MSRLEFTMNLPASPEKLLQMATDYEKLPTYLPLQLNDVRVIEKRGDETVTEETLTFKTLIKNNIKQKSKHVVLNNKIITEIIDGPAKGTKMESTYDKYEDGTKISIVVDLKLSLKAKFLQPIIKKLYKTILTSVLYKMNTVIMQENADERTN